MKFIFYTYDESVRCVLIYLLKNSNITTADCYKWEKESDIILFGIGPGDHNIKYQEKSLYVRVANFIDDKKFFQNQNARQQEFTRQVSIYGNDVSELLIREIFDVAKTYVEEVIRELCISKTHKIKKYIYDSKDMYWDLMSSDASRSVDSLFLKNKEKEQIFDYVKDFFAEDTKNEYEKYNMPYKCNILLYGKPGTGKTSTIIAIASHMNMNIGMIPTDKLLDDAGLINAINSAKRNNITIIVLEDIDCLFNERKIHDSARNSLTLSGILNCMDGLYRNEGILVFMTANNVSYIDDAMLRSNRIDYRLYYDYACKDQIQKCFEYYFPNKHEIFERFYDMYSCKDITISMLQAFFFKNRKCTNILDHISELDDLINGIKEEQKDSIVNMYL